MIDYDLQQLLSWRHQMCVALNYERLYGTSEPGWVERRLALRLKIDKLDALIAEQSAREDERAKRDNYYLFRGLEHLQEIEEERKRQRAERRELTRQRDKERRAIRAVQEQPPGTGPTVWADVPPHLRIDEEFLMTRWGASQPGWVQYRLDLARRARCSAAVKWKDASRFDRWSQCTQPTAPGATFCRVHGGPLMPPKDGPPRKPTRVEPVMPQRMWLHPTEPAEVIPPVPITEGQPARDLAPHLSYTEIESRARAMVFHNYATLGRKRSRRYEGFR